MALARYLEMFAGAGLAIVFLIVVTLVIQAFRDSITDTSSPAYKTANQSLGLFTNLTSQFGTIGTIGGVLALLAILGFVGFFGYMAYKRRVSP